MLDIFIWAVLGWGANAILLCALGDHKYNGFALFRFWVLVVFGNSIISALLFKHLVFELFAPLCIIVAMILELVPYFLTTTGHIGKRVFFAINCTFVVAIISVFILMLFESMSLMGSIFKLFVCITLYYLYKRFVRKPLEATICNLDHHWIWLNITALLFSALFYTSIVGYIQGAMPTTQLVIVMIISFVVYIGLFNSLHYMSVAITLSQSQLQEETLLGQVKKLMEMEDHARIMRHDLRHHNNAIISFLQQGQYDDLHSYLKEFDQSLIEENKFQFCVHPLINNILGVYDSKAAKAGIKFSAEAYVGLDCPIGQRDLLGLLSNLLENALNGCKGKGEIRIKLFEKGNKIIILCENTSLSPVVFQDGLPKNPQRKSSGINSILRTVKLYDGMVDFRQIEAVFTVHIILNIK